MTTTLKKNLARYIGINTGKTPIQLPSDIESIKLLRIFIGIIRTAEYDYLSPGTSDHERAKAEQTLFGIHLSPLPGVCRTLGMDHHEARLKLVEWKFLGLVGDPIFEYLTKSKTADKYETGSGINSQEITGKDG